MSEVHTTNLATNYMTAPGPGEGLEFRHTRGTQVGPWRRLAKVDPETMEALRSGSLQLYMDPSFWAEDPTGWVLLWPAPSVTIDLRTVKEAYIPRSGFEYAHIPLSRYFEYSGMPYSERLAKHVFDFIYSPEYRAAAAGQQKAYDAVRKRKFPWARDVNRDPSVVADEGSRESKPGPVEIPIEVVGSVGGTPTALSLEEVMRWASSMGLEFYITHALGSWRGAIYSVTGSLIAETASSKLDKIRTWLSEKVAAEMATKQAPEAEMPPPPVKPFGIDKILSTMARGTPGVGRPLTSSEASYLLHILRQQKETT